LKTIIKSSCCLLILTLLALIGGRSAWGQTNSILFSTYLGGSNRDEGNAVAFGGRGSIWVTGLTFSTDFPTAFRPPFEERDGPDIFTGLFSADGEFSSATLLSFSFHYGISSGIAVGGTGGAHVVGTSFNLFESILARAFVSKVFPRGNPQYTRFMGGDYGRGNGVAADAAGNAYVTGTGFFQEFGLLFNEAFVAKLGPDGSILYYTSLTGFSVNEGRGIVVDAAGNAYVTGTTSSSDFPTVNAADNTLNGSSDAFVTKLDPSGGIIYSTFLGGSGFDQGAFLALAGDGTLYVAGGTHSADFPAAQGEQRGPNDLFLARLSSEGEVLASTYLGGSNSESLQGFNLDASGFLYLASSTDSVDSPLRSPGCDRQFLTKFRAEDFSIVASSCLPGADVRGLAVDPSGLLALTGVPLSGFPVVNAWQPTPRGQDAFLTVLRLNASPDCSTAFASPATIWPPNGQLVPVSILGVTDPDGDPVTLTVTGIRQDESLSRSGTPDAIGIGTGAVQVRADRSGKGDGRVYLLGFEARDVAGATCAGEVSVCVPHDQRPGATCGDGGALFDSAGSR
jgi:Beta-propeller repeat